MTHHLARIIRHFFIVVSCALLLPVAAGAVTTKSPADIENPVKEASLTTITLTEKAESRLGIETAVAISKQLPSVLQQGGLIIAIPGRDIIVTAPVTGTIHYMESGGSVLVGKEVKKNEAVMDLYPLPPEEDIIIAREDVTIKEAAYKAALEQFNREKMLLSKNASSEKSFEAAEAALAAARGELNTAKTRLRMLDGEIDTGGGESTRFKILSPFTGVIQEVYAGSGQAVSASSPLFKVAGQDPVWVRVPVYVGDLADIDRGQNATILPMGRSDNKGLMEASPVNGPPTSTISNATSDLFYQLANSSGKFRIGEKVMVNIPKQTGSACCVVPYAAIVYDIYGGSWVYVKTAPQAYTRLRVEVSHVVGGQAVLTRGLEAGSDVVVAGVAELFGTEFGGGK